MDFPENVSTKRDEECCTLRGGGRFLAGIVIILCVLLLPCLAPSSAWATASVFRSDVQSAIGMFLGSRPAQAWVDTDGSGSVSIAELQQALNGFLGLNNLKTVTDSPDYNAKNLNTGLALAMDAHGIPHLLVGGDHFYHFSRLADGWHREIIDLPGAMSGSLSAAKLFIDTNGALHFVFRDGLATDSIKYASNAGGSWSVQTLNAQVAAVDKNGHLHTVYYDPNSQMFFYRNNTAGSWSTESFLIGSNQGTVVGGVDLGGLVWGSTSKALSKTTALTSGPSSPQFLSLAVDSAGKAHVAYATTPDQGSVLFYASNASGSWLSGTLDQTASILPTGIALVVDQAGVPHIAYAYYEVINGFRTCSGPCDNADQVDDFTRAADGSWSKTMVDGRDAPAYLCLLAGNQGTLHLLVGYSGFLQYDVKSAGVWTKGATLNQLAHPAAVAGALDSSGVLHVVELGTDGLRYASPSGASWQVEDISLPNPVGQYPDLAVDASGGIHVSYWDAGHRTLFHALASGNGTWSAEPVQAQVNLAGPANVAVDASGAVRMAFIDVVANRLYYAEKTATGWSVQPVGDNAYQRPKMAVDGLGHSHIVYLDGNSSLHYATNSSGTWTRSLLMGGSLSHPDIAVSAAGILSVFFEAHWSAEAVLDAGMWLAQKELSAPQWSTENVYAGSVEDSGCSVKTDGPGDVHVVYRLGVSMSGGKLMYAKKGNAGWQQETVASGAFGKIALALGPNGKRAISYYDYVDGVVKLAANPGSGWLTAPLVPLNTYTQPDFLAPVAFDAHGQLYAAYFDFTVEDLKLLKVMNPRLLP